MSASSKGIGEAKSYDGSDLRIGIVHARWNSKIVGALVDGATKSLQASGVQDDNIVVQSVPGSFELPYAAQRMYASSQIESTASAAGSLLSGAAADLLGSASQTDLTKAGSGSGSGVASKPAPKKPFDALIAIGVLIKGETMHFEYISDAVSHALMRVQLEMQVPVVFGVLTVLDEGQGLARAGIASDGGGGHNHGEDWAKAAVELGVKRRAWGEGTFVE